MSASFQDLIDSHDVIIRVGAEHWPWPDTGTRTDVWVLDGQGSREYLDTCLALAKPTAAPGETSPEELPRVRKVIKEIQDGSIPWVVLKPGTRLRLVEILKGFAWSRVGNIRAQVIWSRKPVFAHFRGLESKLSEVNLSQIPLVLLELFLLKPRVVSVYGTDFYTRPGLAYSANSPSFQSHIKNGLVFLNHMLEPQNHPIHSKRIAQWIRAKRGWPGGDPDFIFLTEMPEHEFLGLFDVWHQAGASDLEHEDSARPGGDSALEDNTS
jgi:hypothetical protein